MSNKNSKHNFPAQRLHRARFEDGTLLLAPRYIYLLDFIGHQDRTFMLDIGVAFGYDSDSRKYMWINGFASGYTENPFFDTVSATKEELENFDPTLAMRSGRKNKTLAITERGKAVAQEISDILAYTGEQDPLLPYRHLASKIDEWGMAMNTALFLEVIGRLEKVSTDEIIEIFGETNGEKRWVSTIINKANVRHDKIFFNKDGGYQLTEKGKSLALEVINFIDKF